MTLSDYVAALAGDLRVGPFRRRRILVEVEDHLRASVDERLAFDNMTRKRPPRSPRDGSPSA